MGQILSPCILWTGARSSAGYGQRRIDGRAVYTHRIAYEEAYGPIPDGLVLDHLCRNPACMNPEHLEAVTRGENVLRGFGPSARQARQTHCKRGHVFDEANTYHHRGHRQCRVCNAERARRRAG